MYRLKLGWISSVCSAPSCLINTCVWLQQGDETTTITRKRQGWPQRAPPGDWTRTCCCSLKIAARRAWKHLVKCQRVRSVGSGQHAARIFRYKLSKSPERELLRDFSNVPPRGEGAQRRPSVRHSAPEAGMRWCSRESSRIIPLKSVKSISINV